MERLNIPWPIYVGNQVDRAIVDLISKVTDLSKNPTSVVVLYNWFLTTTPSKNYYNALMFA